MLKRFFVTVELRARIYVIKVIEVAILNPGGREPAHWKQGRVFKEKGPLVLLCSAATKLIWTYPGIRILSGDPGRQWPYLRGDWNRRVGADVDQIFRLCVSGKEDLWPGKPFPYVLPL